MKQFIEHVDAEYLSNLRGGQWKLLKNFLH
jgi:hypothetical protein